ncbi:ATP-dependent DNA helicase PIF1-like [Ipomoea triloba]|uniref:ATP-dependent DNA helicase PIF1-like n=1 Tax=Ipomoea triloba TaxID=35885 RepID=UPI00125D4B3E|nr:ATP-dependent DNA helicase PIF1-like [Ipomoea triloba]
MPLSDIEWASSSINRMVQDELRYDIIEMHEEHTKLIFNLTTEQHVVYSTIISAIDINLCGIFFVYGYGGTEKTFVWRTLSATLRSKGDIVLNVASSGIASLLLPGGRTAHSRFAIPLNPNEDSTCNINQGSELAELIVKCKLIIWDEAPMMHKHCFEALDRSLRDILRFNNPQGLDVPFGGKTVVFGGDFRQILPVIPKGTRQDIVHATINASYLWRYCKVLRLTKNMRLQNSSSNNDYAQLKHFSEWIAKIGDGKIEGQTDECEYIEILGQILLQYSTDPIKAIVESTYPSFSSIIDDPSYLQKRAILTPTLDVVHSINEYISSLNTSDGITYLSCDSTCKSDSNVDMLADVHTPEFLNGINCSGVPNHALTLKVGTPVMLLRNIDHSIGLCNGTRMVITKLGNHVLEARILSRSSAVSRVTTPEGLKILICDSESTRKTSTANIVYNEVFQNL